VNTEPNTEPKAKKFWEVTFTFVSGKECRTIVEAANQHEAEALIEGMLLLVGIEPTTTALEELSSDVLEDGIYRGVEGSKGDKFVQDPECDYEEEAVEDVACYGPLTEEDL
jgi:hypothetical protein